MATKPPSRKKALRVFLDTNLLLDIVDRNRVGHQDAVALLWYAEESPQAVELLASISSFKDMHYILGRLLHDEVKARDYVARVMGALVRPVDLLAAYGGLALESGEPDFEDALIRTSAEAEGADILLSRDDVAFAQGGVRKMTAGEFLEQQGFRYEEVSL